ncbi:MAG: hypothetical protein LIP77_07475 [Planctomycetes bacterium]|nr:hypothetical protein [Planctomycetota bacterium]
MREELPDEIMEAVKAIRAMEGKVFLTRREREVLHRAKLRIAYWACRSEGVPTTRENLGYILGADAAEILAAYDRYVKQATSAAPAAGKSDRDGGGEFLAGG